MACPEGPCDQFDGAEFGASSGWLRVGVVHPDQRSAWPTARSVSRKWARLRGRSGGAAAVRRHTTSTTWHEPPIHFGKMMWVATVVTVVLICFTCPAITVATAFLSGVVTVYILCPPIEILIGAACFRIQSHAIVSQTHVLQPLMRGRIRRACRAL